MRLFATLVSVLVFVGSGLRAENADKTAANPDPVRIVIAGLTHGHSARFVTRVLSRPDVKLVAIVEPDEQLVTQAMERHKLPRSIFVPKLEPLLAAGGVDAVAGFNMTYEHRELVETCAKHGVQVMVEKPLAANLEHARAIEAAAKRGNIHVIVNYEPIWSAAYQQAFALVHQERKVGELRRFLAFDGNDGPVGKSPPEFVRWLIDPKLNGGGALMDFACYGSALACWFLDGERPLAVTATTQNLKPQEYARVEDDSTVILTYRDATAVIMGSWDWPIARKEFEVYGAKGYVTARFPNEVRMRTGAKEQTLASNPVPADWADPLTYFCAVTRGRITPSGPAALATNLLVMEILDAARESARTGRRVDLPKR